MSKNSNINRKSESWRIRRRKRCAGDRLEFHVCVQPLSYDELAAQHAAFCAHFLKMKTNFLSEKVRPTSFAWSPVPRQALLKEQLDRVEKQLQELKKEIAEERKLWQADREQKKAECAAHLEKQIELSDELHRQRELVEEAESERAEAMMQERDEQDKLEEQLERAQAESKSLAAAEAIARRDRDKQAALVSELRQKVLGSNLALLRDDCETPVAVKTQFLSVCKHLTSLSRVLMTAWPNIGNLKARQQQHADVVGALGSLLVASYEVAEQHMSDFKRDLSARLCPTPRDGQGEGKENGSGSQTSATLPESVWNPTVLHLRAQHARLNRASADKGAHFLPLSKLVVQIWEALELPKYMARLLDTDSPTAKAAHDQTSDALMCVWSMLLQSPLMKVVRWDSGDEKWFEREVSNDAMLHSSEIAGSRLMISCRCIATT